MSAPQLATPVSGTPRTPHKVNAPREIGRRLPVGGAPRRGVLAGSLLVTLLAGCQHDSGIGIKPMATATSPAVATTAPAPTEQELVLAQYRTFWASLTAVSRMPAARRRAALEPYTTDPELKSLLAGMLDADRKGQALYGANVPHATARVDPSTTTAVLDDCQDSTRAGVVQLKSGQRLTVGVARNHVVVTMKKTAGTWKVYFVSYTKTPC